MLREDTHRKIEQEAKSDSSMHENYIHVLVAKMIVNEIFNEHEAQMKAKDEEIERLKAIVEEAMKSKTCYWCKHYEEKQCTNENSIAFGGINAVYTDDFCNDFEPKDKA